MAKRFAQALKKPQLVELLTDIIASHVNNAAVVPAIDRAHDALAKAKLWNDEPLPVVDGDDNADVYGWATSPHYAKVIASECFADEISHVEQYGPVKCQDGTEYPEAYVVVTKPGMESRCSI